MLWARVLLERRYWTSLSVTVLAAFALLLSVAGGATLHSPTLWVLAATGVTSAVIWLKTFGELGRISRRLGQTRLLWFSDAGLPL